MEVFAATLAFQDHQIGRIIDELKESGDFDNTLIMFVEGDNGGSAEGGLEGNFNEIGRMANEVEEPETWLIDMMDTMGGPESYQNYPAAWAWAMNGLFTVVGGLMSVLLSIYLGFTLTLIIALMIYLLGWLAFARFRSAAMAEIGT